MVGVAVRRDARRALRPRAIWPGVVGAVGVPSNNRPPPPLAGVGGYKTMDGHAHPARYSRRFGRSPLDAILELITSF